MDPQPAVLLQSREDRGIFSGLKFSTERTGFTSGLEDRRLQALRQTPECLAAETQGTHGDGVAGRGDFRAHLVELHLLNSGRLVFRRLDDSGLDSVVDLAVGNDRRSRAHRLKNAGLNGSTHHPHGQTFQLLHVGDRLVDDQVSDATAGIPNQPDVGLFGHFFDNWIQGITLENHVPVIHIPKQERHVHERCRFGERGHVGR